MARMMIRCVASVPELMKYWEIDYEAALRTQESDMNKILTEMDERSWNPVKMTGSPEQGITILFE